MSLREAKEAVEVEGIMLDDTHIELDRSLPEMTGRRLLVHLTPLEEEGHRVQEARAPYSVAGEERDRAGLMFGDYLELVAPEDIRIRGTRVGLDTVVYAFKDGLSPEEIVQEYPSLNLEQVYAVIAYYLGHRSEVEDYLARLERKIEEQRRERAGQVPPVVRRLRSLRERSNFYFPLSI